MTVHDVRRFPTSVQQDVRMQGFDVSSICHFTGYHCHCVDCLVPASFCPCPRSRHVDVTVSENSTNVAAPDVVPIASELLDPNFVSCEDLILLLWLLLLQLTNPLRELMDLRCKSCLSLLHLALPGRCSVSVVMLAPCSCCCCCKCGRSKPALHGHVSGKRTRALFCGQMSQRACVGVIVKDTYLLEKLSV